MKHRESGIDLIRCLGLLFVVGLHSFLKNDFYYLPQTGALMWAANSFYWLFFTCNGIFMLLTGYLKSAAAWNRRYYRSLAAVLVGYVLTCLISYPIRHFLLGEKLTLWQWLVNFCTFSNYAWYVEMYLGLILISPLINLALQRVDSTRGLLILAGSLVFLTALPSIAAINPFPDYWTALYPVTYYVLGAVLRRLQPKWRPWLCLAGAAAISMGLGLVTLLTADKGFSSGFGQGYGGFWVTATVVLLFLGLYRLNIRPGFAGLLAWSAGGVFEGYILSRLLDVWMYELFPQWHSPQWYPVLFLAVTLPIFFLSLLAGKAVHTLSEAIIRKNRA